MFNTGLTGSGIHDSSARFRMYLVMVFGIFAFGSVLYWRSQLFVASDYVELPKKVVAKNKKAGSENYQIEYLEEQLK